MDVSVISQHRELSFKKSRPIRSIVLYYYNQVLVPLDYSRSMGQRTKEIVKLQVYFCQNVACQNQFAHFYCINDFKCIKSIEGISKGGGALFVQKHHEKDVNFLKIPKEMSRHSCFSTPKDFLFTSTISHSFLQKRFCECPEHVMEKEN